MGGGSWTTQNFVNYVSNYTGRDVDCNGNYAVSSMQLDKFYTKQELDKGLSPYKVTRECCNSEEHPNTLPVILALDVTGSMGSAAMRCAAKLNEIMTTLYDKVQDVEFMFMGIGDMIWDNAPLQVTQFESDVRIAEQCDKIYFEGCGGGNAEESYSAAWYFGARHTNCDCWKQGRKGIIITLGDEPLNKNLPSKNIARFIGDNIERDIDTKDIYNEAKEKFNIYHIAVNDKDTSYEYYANRIQNTFGELLGDNLKIATLDSLPQVIIDIIISNSNNTSTTSLLNENGVIDW